MNLRTFLFGKPLRSDAEAEEQIGPLQGIPVLGLDALASASYGPEAALTILLVIGAAASQQIVPVSAAIIGLLLILGALTTTAALGVVMVSKFSHGAWITALVIPGFVLFFRRLKRYNEGLASAVRAEGPLDVSNLAPPVLVVPLRRLDQVGEKALRFALSISPDVYVVQVLAEELDTEDLESQWRERVEEPVRREPRSNPPQLVVIHSSYRKFFERFLAWLHELTAARPDRQVIVLIPELVQRRWYPFVVDHRALRLKAQLLIKGGPLVSVMSTPWYPDLPPREAQSRWLRARPRRLRSEDI
jgi:hypothetical protein